MGDLKIRWHDRLRYMLIRILARSDLVVLNTDNASIDHLVPQKVYMSNCKNPNIRTNFAPEWESALSSAPNDAKGGS